MTRPPIRTLTPCPNGPCTTCQHTGYLPVDLLIQLATRTLQLAQATINNNNIYWWCGCGDLIDLNDPTWEQHSTCANCHTATGTETINPAPGPDETIPDDLIHTTPRHQPHSRACGIHPHPHGPQCAPDCPTCNPKTDT